MAPEGRERSAFPLDDSDLIRRERCPVCAATHVSGPTVDGLTFARCTDCGLVFMEPMPTQRWYDARYVADYWEGQAKRQDPFEETMRRLRKEHLRAVTYAKVAAAAGLPDRGALLEIGCGAGGAAATLAHALGWRAFGVEPDVASRALASAIGVTVDTTSVDGFVAKGQKFDLVLLSHVLEHVVDHDRFLEQVLRLLSPDGVLLIEVPNGMTNESLHLFHPYLFTRRALTTLLGRHGLDARITAHGGASSRMRRHYLLAVGRRSDIAVVRGLRTGRSIGQAWSRAWNRGRILRRIDAALVRRCVFPDEVLLRRWRRLLEDLVPEP